MDKIQELHISHNEISFLRSCSWSKQPLSAAGNLVWGLLRGRAPLAMTEKGLLRPKLSRNDNLIETFIVGDYDHYRAFQHREILQVYYSTNVLVHKGFMNFLRFLMLELRGRSLEP